MQSRKKIKREKTQSKKKDKTRTGKEELRQLKNEAFTNYYRQQLPFLADGEWDEIEALMRTALPVTWRFSGHDESAMALRDKMVQALLPQLEIQPHPLAWYPSHLGWQFDVSRAALRGKDWEGADAPDGAGRSEAVKALHAYLVRENDLGRVQRQEAVSMVPPLLLDVRPGMSVLDLCASPGSKSQQMLEMLATDIHATGAQHTTSGDAYLAEHGVDSALRSALAAVPYTGVMGARGLMIANDADIKRCHLLASRAAKLNSPSLVVTNHDARLFPEVLSGGPLTFDRVLADVPCSGDGTVRKNPLIWRRWTASPGNMLHSLQLQIANKSVRMLKVGGRMVYSTCSLNPIENEAVVARLLLTFGSACVRLVDVSTLLPELKRRPGLSSWQVWHRGQFHDTWASVVERFPSKCPKLEGLFPPDISAEATAALHLERCVRLMPHDNGTGGFFVAVIEKVGAHAAEAGALPENAPEICVVEGAAIVPQELSTNHKDDDDDEQPVDEDAAAHEAGGDAGGDGAIDGGAEGGESVAALANADGDTREAAIERTRACAESMPVLHALGGRTVDAAVLTVLSSYAPLFVPSASLLADLQAFFGIAPSFPLHQLAVRSPTAKALLLLSNEVRALLMADSDGKIKVVNTGVRLFEREIAKGVPCAYRLTQDGTGHTLPAIGKQTVRCTPETARRLLQTKGQLSNETMKELEPALAEELARVCRPGSVACVCTPEDGLPLCIIMLYAPSGAVAPMVKGLEKHALLFRLGVQQPSGGGGAWQVE